MRKSYIITLAVVAALLLSVGAYALFKDDKPTANTPSDSSTASDQPAQEPAGTTDEADEHEADHEERTVTYNDNGFVQKTLTVKVGTTVFFTNGSTQLMWVASDPHPVHTDLPGFDAKKGIAPGESYEYTFAKKGSWGFHNHLESSHRGTVVVE